MAKKSISAKLRELLDGSPASSNRPMTKGEIATVVKKKAAKTARKKAKKSKRA